MGERMCLLLALPLLVSGVDCMGVIYFCNHSHQRNLCISYIFLGYTQTSCLLGGDPGVPFFIVGSKPVVVTKFVICGELLIVSVQHH